MKVILLNTHAKKQEHKNRKILPYICHIFIMLFLEKRPKARFMA